MSPKHVGDRGKSGRVVLTMSSSHFDPKPTLSHLTNIYVGAERHRGRLIRLPVSLKKAALVG
jgi:hypothetical protein